MSGYDYDQEKWIAVYKSAVLELEHSLIAGRISDARAEIVKRIEALRSIPGLHGEERQAIEDALHNLRVLEREDAKQAAAQGSRGRARTVTLDCAENQTGLTKVETAITRIVRQGLPIP